MTDSGRSPSWSPWNLSKLSACYIANWGPCALDCCRPQEADDLARSPHGRVAQNSTGIGVTRRLTNIGAPTGGRIITHLCMCMRVYVCLQVCVWSLLSFPETGSSAAGTSMLGFPASNHAVLTHARPHTGRAFLLGIKCCSLVGFGRQLVNIAWSDVGYPEIEVPAAPEAGLAPEHAFVRHRGARQRGVVQNGAAHDDPFRRPVPRDSEPLHESRPACTNKEASCLAFEGA